MFGSYSDRKKEKSNDLKDISDLQKSSEIKNEFNEEREAEYETFEGRINARHNIKTYKEMVESWDKPKEKKSKKSARDLPFFIKNERLTKEEDEEIVAETDGIGGVGGDGLLVYVLGPVMIVADVQIGRAHV